MNGWSALKIDEIVFLLNFKIGVVPIGRNAAERDDGCGQWQRSQRNRRKHEQQPAETGPRGPVRFRWWRNVLRRMGGWQSTRTRRLHRSQRPGRILRFLELRFRSFRCLHLARVKRKKSLSFLEVWYRSDYTSELKTIVYKHTCCLLHPNINASRESRSFIFLFKIWVDNQLLIAVIHGSLDEIPLSHFFSTSFLRFTQSVKKMYFSQTYFFYGTSIPFPKHTHCSLQRS